MGRAKGSGAMNMVSARSSIVERTEAEKLKTFLESKNLYHWTEANQVTLLKETGFSAGVYLTLTGDEPEENWNQDIIWLYKPTRLTIDAAQLDLTLMQHDPYSGEDVVDWDEEERTAIRSFELTENVFYAGNVPASAIIDVKEFLPSPSWKMKTASPEDYGY